MKGEIANEYGNTSWVFVGRFTGGVDGFGGGVFDVEPTASKVGSVLFDGGGGCFGGGEFDNGCGVRV